MKYILGLQLVLLCSFSYSQTNRINKIVVDKNSKIPLENVLIFNESDNSTTNSDGEFMFISQKNEINLNLLGYTAIKTSFEALKNTKDTIFMENGAILLQEVVVSNTIPFMKKVYEKIQDNSIPGFTANFFLRSVLKRDGRTCVLQDIAGTAQKGTNAETMIEILNMRKIKIFEKDDPIFIKFPNLNRVFSFDLPGLEVCTFTEVPFTDFKFKKILFETNTGDESNPILTGYFIVNKIDYAVMEFNLTMIIDPDNVAYLKNDQLRTIKWDVFVKCTKDLRSNKYYANISQLDATVEYFVDGKLHLLDYSLNYFMTKSGSQQKIKPNFPADKDIFKAKFSYSKNFWNNQNQLPLTQELELFLKSVADKKDKKKEYKIIGNF